MLGAQSDQGDSNLYIAWDPVKDKKAVEAGWHLTGFRESCWQVAIEEVDRQHGMPKKGKGQIHLKILRITCLQAE